METKRFSEAELSDAIDILKKDGLIAFPTETVYGLGANALSEIAVKKVFEVKGRPSDNPLIVHVASFEQVRNYVEELHPLAAVLVETYWPGPLTLIFKTKESIFPKAVSAGLSTVSFRMPDNQKTLRLLRESNLPLVGPSANTSGKPSPTTADHVYHDLHGKIEGILEDGATSIGVESTVLDISEPNQVPMILRPGAITQEQLEKDLGIKVSLDKHLVHESEAPRSPGMKYKHYAPDTLVWMIREGDWEKAIAYGKAHQLKMGIVAGPTISKTFEHEVSAVFSYQSEDVLAATQGLFAGLRALDEPQLDLDVIFVATFPEKNLGVAYMNRLKKAANQHFFN